MTDKWTIRYTESVFSFNVIAFLLLALLIICVYLSVFVFHVFGAEPAYPHHDDFCEIYHGLTIIVLSNENNRWRACLETLDYYLLNGWKITQYAQDGFGSNNPFMLEKVK